MLQGSRSDLRKKCIKAPDYVDNPVLFLCKIENMEQYDYGARGVVFRCLSMKNMVP